MSDHIIRAISNSGGIRILVCTAAQLTREVCALQSASATASIALGRGLAGGALMGALLKQDQRVALKFEGNGPLQRLIIEADSDGAVRASAANPAAEAAPLNGRWNVPGIIGKAGFLTVSKDLGLGREPYQGMVQLCSSEIGDDLAYYLTDSEQVPSAVGLGAALAESGIISACGGFLVQALPKADPEEIDAIMTNISALPPLTSLLSAGGPAEILGQLVGSLAFTLLETRNIFFRCGCSRDKVERALLTLPCSDLRDMLEREKNTEVTCEFCRQVYGFDQTELERLLAAASPLE